MAVSYIKLWKLLLDKRLKRVDLKELAGISSSTLAKLGRDDYLSMESMEKICKALGVGIGDVMEFVDSLPEKDGGSING
jgi:DNA-binding Xre family transcriptional regulator